MAHYKAPGLAVLDKGGLAAVRGREWRAGGPQAVMADTAFQARSVSKTVAELLVLHLASGGCLDVACSSRTGRSDQSEWSNARAACRSGVSKPSVNQP
jgi:hypothetical protein